MIYLINSQKGRRVEEILFDHNAENIKEKLTGSTRSSNAYRRKEIQLKKKMILIGTIY